MKKKYILTFTIIMQVVALLFVVSYSWFVGDYDSKDINGDDINISTTEDLILSYKNETYSSLNLNTILSPKFVFEQVSSTGLDNDLFYKIDYTPNLNNMPASYVEATANEDYIEIDVTISSVSKAKRVYLDGVNSGFFVGEEDGEALSTDMTAANAMRCSVSYTDQYSNKRTIVFANNWYKSTTTYGENDVVLDDTHIVLQKDTHLINYIDGYQTYSNGLPLYVNYAETREVNDGNGVIRYEAITPTGVENAVPFSSYDYNSSKENLVLFDLNPYTVKDLKIKIWLDGTACNLNNGVDLISGRPVKFTLRFASSLEMGVECSTKLVEAGMKIDTIRKYNAKATDFTFTDSNDPFYISYASDYYALKNEYFVNNGATLSYSRVVNGVLTQRTYNKVIVDGVSLYKSDDDPLYYNLDEKKGYVKYGDLLWKLSYPGYLPSDTKPTYATIDNYNYVVINNNGSIGDSFTLVGYVVCNGKDVTVVNDSYIYGNAINVTEFLPIAIKQSEWGNIYTDSIVPLYNATLDEFTVNINGEYKTFKYTDNSKFVWLVKNIDQNSNCLQNCSYNSTYGAWVVDYDNSEEQYKEFSIDLTNLLTDKVINLVGCYIDSNNGNNLRDVVQVIYHIDKNH